MKKKLFSVLLALMLILSLSLVTATPVSAAEGESVFTVTDGTYTTTRVDDENGNISATLTGTWDTAVIGSFTATGEGDLYVVDPAGHQKGSADPWGTTADISVSGTLSATEITFSGTAVRTAGDPITDDTVTDITGTIIIQPDGSFVVDLTGLVFAGTTQEMSVDIDMTGSMPTEPWLTKASILSGSGVPGRGLAKAPGQQKAFNPKSQAGEHAGKKDK